MSLDDGIIAVYTEELIALSERTRSARRLEGEHVSAKAVSPVCGSEVTVDLALSGDKIKDIGFLVEACALTRAVMAVMTEAAIGKTRDEVAAAGEAMTAMLAGGGLPAGDWARLGMLAPVRDYPARHNAILLPFEAAEKAFARLP